MAYTAAELSGPVQLGDDKKIFFYDAEDASDSLATVLASGYFNNDDDNIRMEVNDLIQVKTSAGQHMLQVTSSTGGAVGTTLVGGDIPVETGATSANLLAFGLSLLAVAATGLERIYRLPLPTRAGQRKTMIATTATDHTIATTGAGVFGSTGQDRLTLTGAAGAHARVAVELIAISTTRWEVLAYRASTGTSVSSTG